MTTNLTAVATSGPTASIANTAISGSSSVTIGHNPTPPISSLNQLPNDLVANKEIFFNLFSGCDSVWHHLDVNKRRDLMNKYLPKELSISDKMETIEHLVNGSLKRFNNDLLSDAFISLKLHKLSPDLVKALEDVKALKKKLFKIYEQKRQSLLLEEVIQKRRSLVDRSVQTSNRSDMTKNISINLESDRLEERVRLRYQKELKDLCHRNDVSSEGDLRSISDKSLSSKMTSIQSHPISDKQYYEMLRKHRRKRKVKELDNIYEPRLETQSITLSDIIMRVTTPSLTSNVLKTSVSCVDHRKKVVASSSSHNFANSSPKSSSMSVPKKKAKHTNVNKNNQTIPSIQPKILPQINSLTIKLETDKSIASNTCVKSESNPEINVANIKVEPKDLNLSSTNRPTICTLKTSSPLTPRVCEAATVDRPLLTAPLPAIPVLVPSAVSITPEPSPIVTPTMTLENAPKCFFSLLRDIFLANSSNDRRLSLHKLEELVKEKLRTFSPFLGWSTEMVASAMNYLSGVLPPPHLVPLVDYKEKNQQWQWIGDGRDRDQQLVPLCEQWMKNKEADPTAGLVTFSQTLPPPAKCLTDWVVRPSSDEEKETYRRQEAIRYQNPYKAFTYKIHGYESVVGPVKGCGIGAANGHNNSSPNKAREHSLLVSDRPPFVTLLSLVRDAAARLPNGEGTRADICELLKDSQYLLPTISDQQVNGIVSGALDRLHYEKDPCVKYDVNRKVWIYLHRNRTEAEFERLHEVQIAAAKAKRSMSKASRKPSCMPNVPNNQTRQLSIISKTTQQAIHQAVNNILNSEALKITKSSDPSVSSDNYDKSVISSSVEDSKEGLISDLKTSLVSKINKDKPSAALEPLNGSTSSTLTANPLFVSLQANNQLSCKPEAVTTSSVQIPFMDKKKLKFKENKILELQKSQLTSDKANSEPVVRNKSPCVVQTSLNLSVAMDGVESSDTTSSSKSLNKTKNVKPVKPSIKVQIPKTITLPISISQNSLKSQSSVVTTISSESLPALISLANTHNKTINSTPTTTCRPLTKIVSSTQLNSSGMTASGGNQMHQISIPTSVLFGARPASVVLATSTGKSYMMAATGGSIVLQPNSSTTAINSSSEPSSQTSSLAVRTLQGIRVIPVNPNPNSNSKVNSPLTGKTNISGAPVVMASQNQSFNSTGIPPSHQFVARIITTAQANRGNVPQTQIVIPSTSALQPIFLAHSTPSNASIGTNTLSAAASSGSASTSVTPTTLATTTTAPKVSNEVKVALKTTNS